MEPTTTTAQKFQFVAGAILTFAGIGAIAAGWLIAIPVLVIGVLIWGHSIFHN